MKKTYVMVHCHKHGTSIFQFKSEKEFSGWHNEENCEDDEFKDLFEKLGADVEFDNGETIDFIQVDENVIDID